MARRKKPCEFCEDMQIVSDEKDGNQLVTEFYPDNSLWSVHAFCETENGVVEIEQNYQFKYCPFCSRELDLW